MSFGGGDYEIRIKGRLSDSLLAAVDAKRVGPVAADLRRPTDPWQRGRSPAHHATGLDPDARRDRPCTAKGVTTRAI